MARLPTDHRNSLTASAAVVDLRKPIEVKRAEAARQSWQKDAWTFYKRLPEVRYPANFVGAALGRFQLKVGVVDPDNPTAKPVVPEAEGQDAAYRIAAEHLANLQGSGGGHSAILRRFGICMNVNADGWLVGEDKVIDGDPYVDWEFLSTDELQFHEWRGPKGTEMRAFRSRTGEEIDPTNSDQLLPQDAYVRRFWRSSARFSSQADGALESLKDDCERLIALNDSITSRILSRLAQAGLLFLPNGLEIPVTAGDEGMPNGMSPLIWRLIQAMTNAITTRGTAAGAIPIPIVGPPELGEFIRHITLDRSIDETELKLRAETRETIAKGQDLPPEVQSGLKDASHWTTWSVMDSSFRNHLVPQADTFAEGLTRVYLRPGVRGLLEAADEDPNKASTFVVVADGSDVVARPNEAEDARQLHDRATISDKALREKSGVPESDAPDGEEYLRIIGRQTNNPYLATYGLPVHAEVDWDKVAAVGSSPGAPGVGSIPPGKRKADSSDPAGAPGEGDAGGVSGGQVKE